MEYTIQQLAHLSGVTPRTLRYYDQENLLPPKRITSSGYRIYGSKQVDLLQQILFLKQFGLKLTDIKAILANPDFDMKPLLEQQKVTLTQQLTQIQGQLQNLEATLAYYKGEKDMTDPEKFATFKAEKLAENEANYGSEIRARYGEDAVDAANQKWQGMTETQFAQMHASEERLFANLELLLAKDETPDLDSEIAKEAFLAHKEWLKITAPFYNAEYHRSLGEMYAEDERFAAYYNQRTSKPSAKLLRDIILHYTKEATK